MDVLGVCKQKGALVEKDEETVFYSLLLFNKSARVLPEYAPMIPNLSENLH